MSCGRGKAPITDGGCGGGPLPPGFEVGPPLVLLLLFAPLMLAPPPPLLPPLPPTPPPLNGGCDGAIEPTVLLLTDGGRADAVGGGGAKIWLGGRNSSLDALTPMEPPGGADLSGFCLAWWW